jgi:hypothetical protein
MRLAVTGALVAGVLASVGVVASAASEMAPKPGLATIGGTPKYGGAPGRVAVVTMGKYDGNILPVLLKNNTKRTVADVSLSATASTASGKLLVSGEDQGVQPENIPPRGLAMAYVYFDGKKLPANAKYKITVDSTPASEVDFQSNIDVPIKTVRYAGGSVVGLAVNTSSKKISGPLSVYAMCISSTKRIVRFASDYADRDDIPPRGQAPFTVDMTSYGTEPAPRCRYVLVSMRGYDF